MSIKEIEQDIKEIEEIENFRKKSITKASKKLVKLVLESEDNYEARYAVEDLIHKLVKDLNRQTINTMFHGATKL